MSAVQVTRYCLYARKSTEQDERQAMSIDSQIKEMMDLANRDGLQVIATKKESYSAKASAKRPIFNELLEDIRNNKYDGILTWAPDRLSRNAGDLGSLVDLMDAGKLQQIRTYGQSFSNTPNEKFLLMILCSQAKLENDNRSINVKRGIRAKCEMGWRPGPAPIGYINRSYNGVKEMVLDEERAGYIKEIFERSGIHNQSGRTIKDWLDKSKFTTKAGKKLSLSQIYRILTNPFYYGYFTYPDSGPLYKGRHIPIINKELFDIVRMRIDTIVPDNKSPWGSKKFPFRHLLHCGSCGSRLTAEEHFKSLANGTRKRHVYYRCTKSTKDPDCTERSITATNLCSQVLQLVLIDSIKRVNGTEVMKDELMRYERHSNQLAGQIGITITPAEHFKNYANYILNEGDIPEKDNFIRNLNVRLVLTSGTVLVDQVHLTI